MGFRDSVLTRVEAKLPAARQKALEAHMVAQLDKDFGAPLPSLIGHIVLREAHSLNVQRLERRQELLTPESKLHDLFVSREQINLNRAGEING